MKEMIFRTSDDGLVMNNASEIELVRCKDCKYWKDGYMNYDIHPWLPCMETDTKQEWFCAYGERQE